MRISITYLLACMLTASLLAPAPQRAQAAPAVANGVVGDGTAASCTYAELILEMGSPTYVTFACGAAPHTIILAANGGVQPLAGAGTTLDGGGLITLSAANVTNNRLFDVGFTASLTLTHLTLTNATTSAYGGGALRNRGRLVLDDVVLQNSGAQGFWGGGGIWNEAGTLIIRNSTLRANYSAGGGALYNSPGATASIESSTFLSNTVTEGAYGGAISNSGLLTITTSSFTGNAVTLTDCPAFCTYGGGAIANLETGDLVISATTFTRNRADHAGGALNNVGYVSVEDSTFSLNQANSGGAAFNQGVFLYLTRVSLAGNQAEDGGGLYLDSGNASLTDVTIDGNTATRGGGMTAWGGLNTFTRVTVSGNQAVNSGGGIANVASELTFVHTTFTGNSAATGGGLYNAYVANLTHVTFYGNSASAGGGIFNVTSMGTSLVLKNGLLAGNIPQNCAGKVPQSPTYNLSTDATCFTAVNGNLVNTPLNLGPLANNGSLTLTQLPAPGSAAIDSASCIGGLLTDQRGLPRLVGAACDIGAVERQAADFGWYAFMPAALR